MELHANVKIHQYNDGEILAFLNEHRVSYRVIGDHLFVVRSRGGEVAVGPGDQLAITADREVQVRRGDYAKRAQLAIRKAREARAKRQSGLLTAAARTSMKHASQLLGAPSGQLRAGLRESETDR